MIALLVAAFILYLYTPHLLFKFAAATKYDFITRKEVPQVEEFFAAGLPSIFLNGLTFSVLYVGYRILGYSPIVPDRVAASAAFTKDPDLSKYIATADLAPLACYIGALAVFSWWTGRIYGGIIAKVAVHGGTMPYLRAAWRIRSPLDPSRPLWTPLRVAFVAVRVVLVIYRRVWRVFYSQYEHPLYPVVIRNSYAFVHTTHGLYHGIVFQFDRKRDGDVEGIVLIAVSRFSRKKEHECFRQGVNPISDLIGPLFIKWEEILDINYPPNAEVLEDKRQYYEKKLREFAAAKAKRAKRVASYLALQRLSRSRKPAP